MRSPQLQPIAMEGGLGRGGFRRSVIPKTRPYNNPPSECPMRSLFDWVGECDRLNFNRLPWRAGWVGAGFADPLSLKPAPTITRPPAVRCEGMKLSRPQGSPKLVRQIHRFLISVADN